jgi:thymidylate kinase
MSGDANLFREIIAAFERHSLRYCILAGYEGYPESIASDVDFMVLPTDASRIPKILAEVAVSAQSKLVQAIAHETTAAWFVIAHKHGASVVFIQPDLSTDFRRRGRLWLRAQELIERRRLHRDGFWIPSSADSFIYYLIKKIDKGSISMAQMTELVSRYQEDPIAASRLLRRILPGAEVERVQRILELRDSEQLKASIDQLRVTLHHNAPMEPLEKRLTQALADGRRLIDRMTRPTGLTIGFLGPDGSGKSSVIARVTTELGNAFRRVEYQHLRPRPSDVEPLSSPPTVDPHAQAPRGLAGSLLKLTHFWSGYLTGSLRWTYPRLVSSTLVIFDRYYYDLLADPRRYRYGAPLSIARWLGRLVPRPALIFILDAPAEVIQSRKREVSIDESRRQRQAYLDLGASLGSAHVIDASRPLEKVVGDVVSIVLNQLAIRAAQRLDL